MQPKKHYFAHIPTIAIFIRHGDVRAVGGAVVHPEGHRQ